MRLYVPEIGDRIRLTSDWTFGLHHEHRNGDVWDALGCDRDPGVAAARLRHEDATQEIRRLWERAPTVSRTYNHWREGSKTHMVKELTPESQEREQELRQIQRENSEHVSQVTLPRGTVLGVDRIYIRKGNSEFSSLTFYVLECPLKELTPAKKGGGFKRGRKRFWARLSDVNKIQFEPVMEVEA